MAQVTFEEAGTGSAIATTGNITPAYPVTGLAANDLFILIVYNKVNGSTAPNTPSGFNLVTSGGAGNTGMRIYSRLATGSESGTITVSFASDSATVKMGRIYRFRNNKTSSFFGPDSWFLSQGSGSDNTIELPSYTTTANESLLFATVFVHDDNAIVSPTGETGGDWIEPSAEFTTTLGTDGCMGHFTATMSTVGSISGGSVNMGGGASDEWFIIVAEILSANPAIGAKKLALLGVG